MHFYPGPWTSKKTFGSHCCVCTFRANEFEASKTCPRRSKKTFGSHCCVCTVRADEFEASQTCPKSSEKTFESRCCVLQYVLFGPMSLKKPRYAQGALKRHLEAIVAYVPFAPMNMKRPRHAQGAPKKTFGNHCCVCTIRAHEFEASQTCPRSS